MDFDRIVDRRATSSLKWNKYAGRDVIPMWVADMDFPSSPAIVNALVERARHGVFGYTDTPPELNDTIVRHLDAAYEWKIQPDWLIWLPGLVSAINVISRAIGDSGSDVVTAVPVYHPFLTGPVNQQRTVTTVPMRLRSERWEWDFEALEAALTPRTRLLLLCNPHNPVGRVFTHSELSDLARIARKHDLVVAADEIHCGLVLDPDKQHIPFATLDADTAARTITLMAASKTFNLPGLCCAFAIVPDARLRTLLVRTASGIVPRVNAMGYAATLAAYRDSAGWHADLLAYLRGNRALLMEHIAHMPGLSVTPVEATYLAWIAVDRSLSSYPVKLFEDAGVGLYDGRVFGADGYVRLNFGCPRSVLAEALARMERALMRS